MYTHHKIVIDKITDVLKADAEVIAVIVGGSIAHGTATDSSDVDLMILVSDEIFNKKVEDRSTWYFKTIIAENREIIVDGKYISQSYIDKVIKYGNEPTRFAFTGAYTTYSKLNDLDGKLTLACKYPTEKKKDSINRFSAQFMAWKWYSDEALKKNDQYLLNHSVQKMILFGSRLVLAYNEELYPYHKWLMRAVESTKDKPELMVQHINQLLHSPTRDKIMLFYNCVSNFMELDNNGIEWPNTFAEDSEIVWLDRNVPIDDI